MPVRLIRKVKRFVSDRPFLSLGLFTFAAFLAVEGFGMPSALADVLRLLIVPLWFMRTLEMSLGIASLPGPLQFIIGLPLLFLPYVAADWLLGRARRRRNAQHTAVVWERH